MTSAAGFNNNPELNQTMTELLQAQRRSGSEVQEALADEADPKRAQHAAEARAMGYTASVNYDYATQGPTKRVIEEDFDFEDDAPVWAGGAAKYEWEEEYGDLGPAHPLLERQLFADMNQMKLGHEFHT